MIVNFHVILGAREKENIQVFSPATWIDSEILPFPPQHESGHMHADVVVWQHSGGVVDEYSHLRTTTDPFLSNSMQIEIKNSASCPSPQ